jgi:hypothetical protein
MNKHRNNNKGAVIVMAYASCAATMADNIAKDCAKPLAGGYTGRGVLIDLADAPTITRDNSNPRIITGITLAAGKSLAVIDNAFTPQPLNGSNSQSNTDDGMMKHRKTLVLTIPKRGGQASKEIVEPTYQSPLGYLAVLEKKDRNGDGSFEVVGSEQGLVANADGIVRNEYENGGCTIVTMSTNEVNFENVLFATDYETTLAAFEALLAKGY